MEANEIIERLESLAKTLDQVQTLMDESTVESRVGAYSLVYNTRSEIEDLKDDIKDGDTSACGVCGGAVSICDGC